MGILATKASASMRVYRLAVVILLVIWLRSLLNYWGQLYTGLAQCHLSDRIRKLIFEQLQSLSLSYYAKIHSGEPLNSITRIDTILGDRGTRLSGGQRQRIAIARAILRDPEILILDEATSALDSVTERLIQQSLDRLTEGKTVIAIAHRLSTIVKADKVVVLKDKHIVEQGGYKELLVQRGELWKYHQMQFESLTGAA